MRRFGRGILLPVVLLSLGGEFLFCQFLPGEIARRAQWEEFLKTADIVAFARIGEGVTNPWKLTLRQGGVENKGAWKGLDERHGYFADSWKYEIAAYRIDRLIGLNMVPPTVEREFKGKRGSLSLWIQNRGSLLDIEEKKIPIPASAQAQMNDMKYVTRLWACLVANDDLTQQNILITEDWRTILIDHSRAFRWSREYTERLIYGAHGIKTFEDGRPVLFRRVPRRLVDSIKDLDFATVKEAVGPYLTDGEIASVIARKKLLLDEIDAMVRQEGEGKVLY
jgi:hypothetical protein